MNMEEYVQILSELQAERNASESATDADEVVITLREAVADAEKQLEAAKLALSNELRYTDVAIKQIDEMIEDMKSQILQLWDGSLKTIEYDGGKILKFRTTTSVSIGDGAALLAGLIDHFSTNRIADEFISGFHKTAVRKFIDLHPQPPDVVELVANTTVKLEQ